jgi:hypothetical protein
MSVPNTFTSATSAIPLANLDADFAYYDAAFQIAGGVMEVNYTFRLEDPVDNTKKAEFVMSGITTGTTRQYTMPNVTGTLATIANLAQTFAGTTTFSGTFTASGATATLGSSTATSTYGIGSGATTAISTKTVNIGTAGISGSTTNTNIGSAVSGALGTTTMNSNIVQAKLVATSAAAPTIASATTIAPTTQIAFVSGITPVATITAPSPISLGGGTITLIPTGIFTTTTAGNIALASTAIVGRALTMTYDVTTTKWYPSY